MQINFQLSSIAHVNLLLSFMRQFYEIDHYPFDPKLAQAALEGILTDASLGRVWIITEGEAPIGYIVLTLGYSLQYRGRDGFIDELYIEASHRGKGIGSEAVKFVEEASRELGVNALHLEVERGNEGGRALYSKNGFEGHDRYLMTKWIRK